MEFFSQNTQKIAKYDHFYLIFRQINYLFPRYGFNN